MELGGGDFAQWKWFPGGSFLLVFSTGGIVTVSPLIMEEIKRIVSESGVLR